MEYTLPLSLGLLLAIVVVGIAGLVGSGVMTVQTTLMMVAPSMVVFGLIAFGLGVKHGRFRASN